MTRAAIRKDFLTFGAPSIGPEEMDEVAATLESGWLGTGPRVARFERDFAAYKGVEQALATNSCTAALHLSLASAGVGPGDEVITTPLTFCATVNAILHVGATPVLADVDPRSMNVDANRIEAAITSRTKAVLPVHFAGRPCAMDEISAIAHDRNLVVIEDCAHAIESEYRGRKAGTLGDFGCFSFYATKNMTTGEGGMLLASSPEASERARRLSLHGMSRDAWKRFSADGYRHYEVVEAGFKYNMTDLQAALGIHQLRRLEGFWLRRREIWNQYQRALADLPLTLPAEPEPDTRHACHLYTVLVDERRSGRTRDDVIVALTRRNIGVGVHYQALPEHAFYQQQLGWKPDQWPHATRIGRQTVSLPLAPRMTDADVADVIAAVRDVFRASARLTPSLPGAISIPGEP